MRNKWRIKIICFVILALARTLVHSGWFCYGAFFVTKRFSWHTKPFPQVFWQGWLAILVKIYNYPRFLLTVLRIRFLNTQKYHKSMAKLVVNICLPYNISYTILRGVSKPADFHTQEPIFELFFGAKYHTNYDLEIPSVDGIFFQSGDWMSAWTI